MDMAMGGRDRERDRGAGRGRKRRVDGGVMKRICY
jgi:hypothetical protein